MLGARACPQTSQSGERDRSVNKLLQPGDKCDKRGINRVCRCTGRNCFTLPVQATEGFVPKKLGRP